MSRKGTSAQHINMVAKPLLLNLHTDKIKLEDWVQGLIQDLPLGFMMQYTHAEAKVILSKFWRKFLETKGNFIQKDQGVFIKAGQTCDVFVRLFVLMLIMFCL